MYYQEIQPGPLLADFVKCYWVAESDPDDGARGQHGIIPGGYVDLVFNAGDRVVSADTNEVFADTKHCFLVGPFESFGRFQAEGQLRFFGVRFHLGRSPFSASLPLAEIRNQAVCLNFVSGRHYVEKDISIFESELAEAHGTVQRIASSEKFFLKLLNGLLIQDTVVARAVAIIEESQGLMPVEKLGTLVGVSSRHLERKFAIHIGLSPKTFCRITRFRQAKSLLENIYGPASCDLAYKCGYYDQTQLIREFRLFAGHTPVRYKTVKPVGFFLYDPHTHC
jgi:AraC-like DNA-binding protein